MWNISGSVARITNMPTVIISDGYGRVSVRGMLQRLTLPRTMFSASAGHLPLVYLTTAKLAASGNRGDFECVRLPPEPGRQLPMSVAGPH